MWIPRIDWATRPARRKTEIFRQAGFDVHSSYDVFKGLDRLGDGGYDRSGTPDHFPRAGNEIIAQKLAAYIAK